MKWMHGAPEKRILGVCMLTVTLFFGSVLARADVVLDWNVIAVNTAIANGQNPFAQARFAAIAQLAVFEAVNSITGDYRPYLGTIVAPLGASADAAAIQAAYRVLSTYFPASASTLDAERANSLASIPDGQAKNDGIATGEAAALAMITLRANDGSSPPQFKIPGPPVPGDWLATPSCPIINGIAVGVFFQWQYVTPFGIPSASEFLLDPPPTLTSNQSPRLSLTAGALSASGTSLRMSAGAGEGLAVRQPRRPRRFVLPCWKSVAGAVTRGHRPRGGGGAAWEAPGRCRAGEPCRAGRLGRARDVGTGS